MIILLKFPGTPQSFGCATENFIYKESNRKQLLHKVSESSLFTHYNPWKPVNCFSRSKDIPSRYCFINTNIQQAQSVVDINPPRTLINVADWLPYRGYIFEKIFRLTLRETWVQSLGWEDPLEKEMAIHSSTIAWKIPWTEEPGGLQSMVSQRIRHHWATSLSLFTFR